MKKSVVVLLAFLLLLSGCKEDKVELSDLEKQIEAATGYEKDYLKSVLAFDEKLMEYEMRMVMNIPLINMEMDETSIIYVDALNQIYKMNMEMDTTIELKHSDTFVYFEDGIGYDLEKVEGKWVRTKGDYDSFVDSFYDDVVSLFESVEPTDTENGKQYVVETTFGALVEVDPSYKELTGEADDDTKIILTVEFDSDTKLISYYEIDLSQIFIDLGAEEAEMTVSISFVDFIDKGLPLPDIHATDDYPADMVSAELMGIHEIEYGKAYKFNSYSGYDEELLFVSGLQDDTTITAVVDNEQFSFSVEFYDADFNQLVSLDIVELDQGMTWDLADAQFMYIYRYDAEPDEVNLELTFD